MLPTPCCHAAMRAMLSLVLLLVSIPGVSQSFTSDIPLLQAKHLDAQYWLAPLADADQVILSVSQINALNEHTFAVQPEMFPLDALPAALSKAELTAKVLAVSAVPQSARYFADGRALSAADWAPLQAALNIEGIQAQNPVRFALTVQRTALLAMPTRLRVFNEGMALDLNRFQETALFVGEPVAVLHQSTDANWFLVQNYHYTGWVAATDLALGTREQVLAFAQAEPFLVVTGDRIQTNFVPEQPHISRLTLDMGVRLPLLSSATLGHNLYGQNPHASYVVQLPVRDEQGNLSLQAALIGRNQDVHLGYLPYTTRQLLQQAFKYLGQRYGWGYDYDGVDCTGLLVDVFRTFGIFMPRNSGQQGYGEFGQNQRFAEQLAVSEKRALLKAAPVGALLYRPGHVMIYLGESDGEPFVLHSVFDLAYYQPDGQFYQGVLNGVAVTPLTPLYLNPEQHYLDRLYNIKTLR